MSKTDDIGHPDRADLLAAAQTGRHRLGPHLKRCAECRELYEMFRATRAYRDLVRGPVDSDLVARCAAIPVMEQVDRGLRIRPGTIGHDSWSDLPAMALRDIDQGGERRLRLLFGPLTLELVAQRTGSSWQMSARLFGGQGDDRAVYIIRAGRRKITAGEHGMFVWADRQPPRSIELITPGELFRCAPISWRGAL